MNFWWNDERHAWEIELDKLSHIDFERLNIDKEKLHQILDQLYKWRIIR